MILPFNTSVWLYRQPVDFRNYAVHRITGRPMTG